MKLLIAEDDLSSRTLLAAVSRKWGFEPVVVDNGEAAWHVLQATDPPRLMLLDWMMPELDGLSLCRRIRAQKTSDPPYIILLTSRSETDDIVAGLQAGSNEYIAKPYDNAELQARLQVGRRMLNLQTELNKAKETLVFQATHDSLTGLLNRRAIIEALKYEIACAQRQSQVLCVGLCDLDHFKQINDTYGHAAGDTVLRETVRRIVDTLGPHDKFGRYGGEEFLLLINSDPVQEQNLFEEICSKLADMPFVLEQTNLVVTMSCGVTLFSPPSDKRDATALLAAADVALYEAKASGRNRTVTSSSSFDHHSEG